MIFKKNLPMVLKTVREKRTAPRKMTTSLRRPRLFQEDNGMDLVLLLLGHHPGDRIRRPVHLLDPDPPRLPEQIPEDILHLFANLHTERGLVAALNGTERLWPRRGGTHHSMAVSPHIGEQELHKVAEVMATLFPGAGGGRGR